MLFPELPDNPSQCPVCPVIEAGGSWIPIGSLTSVVCCNRLPWNEILKSVILELLVYRLFNDLFRICWGALYGEA